MCVIERREEGPRSLPHNLNVGGVSRQIELIVMILNDGANIKKHVLTRHKKIHFCGLVGT